MKPLITLLFLLHTAFAFGTTAEEEAAFTIAPVSKDVQARIEGKSYPLSGNRVALSQLRYLRVLHWNANGEKLRGELIVNEAIAKEVIEIFKELYDIKFPIERLTLIDNYNADDETSMRANNSSAFCHRAVKGQKRLSKHARGLAIDLNPLYNPCFKTDPSGKRPYKEGTLQPATAAAYVSRDTAHPYVITQQVIDIFRKHGFRWGGYWKSKKDYQHFEH